MAFLFGVIADDFTGACDVGVQFRKCGLETAVLTCMESLSVLKSIFEVVVIDTESRNIVSEIAYEKVGGAARALKKMGIKPVYKKIDSTLRGNLGAEINAVMDELGVKAVIVAPAFPAYDRTTINGCLLVKGVPLERTEFADDPSSPMKESNIAALIGRQTQRRIGYIDLSQVRSDVGSLRGKIQRLIDDGEEIIVADAENQSDLAKIAEASIDFSVLLCGSAGLAGESSRLLASRLRGSRLIIVSGSINSVTLNQIAMAEKESDVRVLEPNLSRILLGKEEREAETRNLASETKKTLAEGKDIIISSARSRRQFFEAKKLGKQLGMDDSQIAEKLLSVLGQTLKWVVENYDFAGIVLVGGDTAIRMMNALNAHGIRIEEDVLPGIPAGRILGGKCDGLKVVTKAGGFGDSHALVEVMKYLKGGDVR